MQRLVITMHCRLHVTLATRESHLGSLHGNADFRKMIDNRLLWSVTFGMGCWEVWTAQYSQRRTAPAAEMRDAGFEQKQPSDTVAAV